MTDLETPDAAAELVEEVLYTALAIEDVISALLGGLVESAFPGKRNPEALLQMVVGSVRPTVEAAGEDECRAAIALVTALRHRVLDDLSAAADRPSSETQVNRTGDVRVEAGVGEHRSL